MPKCCFDFVFVFDFQAIKLLDIRLFKKVVRLTNVGLPNAGNIFEGKIIMRWA